ncbi:hypothetical protein VTK73DRAFT_3880 [Phialemonium thermophilum]|uniref:Peroxin/Ferlin domain-containing protein n=1 Tax=Phialemonium thermophilum TaxID=223376 RepID=A0ABR3WX04_9PEZI
MAALETPWLTHMSTPRSQRGDPLDSSSLRGLGSPSRSNLGYQDAAPPTSSGAPNPTYAAFSPTTLSSTTPSATSAAKRRSTILVHQKSPLLLATPPQITRALAYSHPFILMLNKLVGLLSWTSGDPWESFLLVALFWATVLYGDAVIRLAGPVVLVLILIAGMYGRRFSPLSSSGRSEPKLGSGDGSSLSAGETKGVGKTSKRLQKKNLPVDSPMDKPVKANGGGGSQASGHSRTRSAASAEATNTHHQKTLDEIVETLKEFTARCNILLEPLLELTDFLSTQSTPTSATTRPALTALFVRILLCTPFWFILTLPPLRIVTTRRVVLVCGTVVLTWHSRVARVTRALLWRSATVRRLLVLITGLQFDVPLTPSTKSQSEALPSLSAGASVTSLGAGSAAGDVGKNGAAVHSRQESELTKALKRAKGGRDAGVRFTFIIYENQRRWIGLGWTSSLFAYERAAWTDEHNNPVPPKDEFELPEVEEGNTNMRWRWVEGSRWRVDGVPDEAVAGAGDDSGKDWDYDGPGGRMGWVYYDNKWQNGRRGQDGWGRWTRRRKWYRDAELVELGDSEEDQAANSGPSAPPPQVTTTPASPLQTQEEQAVEETTPSLPTTDQQPPFLHQRTASSSSNPVSSVHTAASASNSSSDPRSSILAEKDEEDYDTTSLLSTSLRSTRLKSGSVSQSRRSRRLSEPTDEEDAAALTTQLGLSPQGGGSGEGSGWGVGDEVRMGLE